MCAVGEWPGVRGPAGPPQVYGWYEQRSMTNERTEAKEEPREREKKERSKDTPHTTTRVALACSGCPSHFVSWFLPCVLARVGAFVGPPSRPCSVGGGSRAPSLGFVSWGVQNFEISVDVDQLTGSTIHQPHTHTEGPVDPPAVCGGQPTGRTTAALDCPRARLHSQGGGRRLPSRSTPIDLTGPPFTIRTLQATAPPSRSTPTSVDSCRGGAGQSTGRAARVPHWTAPPHLQFAGRAPDTWIDWAGQHFS